MTQIDEAEIDALADRVGATVKQKLDQQAADQNADRMQQTIADIGAHYRELRYLTSSRIAISNRLGAYVRRALGWSADLPEADQERIRKAAAKAISDGDPRFADIVAATEGAAKAFEVAETGSARTLRKLAETLPVWTRFGAEIKGFGPLGLAVILGEAGDIGNYDGFAKLWKRLGLGIVGDKQQGKPGKHATAEDWIEHGYNAQRRAAIFAYIGTPLLKADNLYRELYLRRKVYETERGKTKMHAHRAAQRYAEKMLIKHLWKAWRRDDPIAAVEMTMPCVSTAAPLEAAC